MHQYRLSPELFVQYKPQTTTTITTGSDIHFNNLNNHFGYGLHVKFGRKITNRSLLFGFFGIQDSQFHYSILSYPNPNISKWQWGWTAGIGTESMLTKHLTASLNINYSHYHISTDHSVGIIKETPSTVITSVGLNYYFN